MVRRRETPRLLLVVALLALLFQSGADTRAAERPNVVIILADDLGYSDLGCYGGEIRTPQARRPGGAMGCGSRSSTTRRDAGRRVRPMLTGYYAQQVRRDVVPGVPSGGSGTRPPWAKLLPEMLRPLGYRSYHSGKWHVDGMPLANGFDHSYYLRGPWPLLPSARSVRGRSAAARRSGRGRGYYDDDRHRRPCHRVPQGPRREPLATDRSSSTSPSTRPTSLCRLRPKDIADYRGRYIARAGKPSAPSAGGGSRIWAWSRPGFRTSNAMSGRRTTSRRP